MRSRNEHLIQIDTCREQQCRQGGGQRNAERQARARVDLLIVRIAARRRGSGVTACVVVRRRAIGAMFARRRRLHHLRDVRGIGRCRGCCWVGGRETRRRRARHHTRDRRDLQPCQAEQREHAPREPALVSAKPCETVECHFFTHLASRGERNPSAARRQGNHGVCGRCLR